MLVGALKMCRIQPGSWQGWRCGLRSVSWGHNQRQDPAWFSAGTEKRRRDHDVGSGVCTGVQQGQVPKYFSARLKMLAQACFQGSWTWVALSLVQCRNRDLGSQLSVPAWTCEEASLIQCRD